MDKVSFTAMEHGTQADYDIVMKDEASKNGELAERVLGLPPEARADKGIPFKDIPTGPS